MKDYHAEDDSISIEVWQREDPDSTAIRGLASTLYDDCEEEEEEEEEYEDGNWVGDGRGHGRGGYRNAGEWENRDRHQHEVLCAEFKEMSNVLFIENGILEQRKRGKGTRSRVGRDGGREVLCPTSPSWHKV